MEESSICTDAGDCENPTAGVHSFPVSSPPDANGEQVAATKQQQQQDQPSTLAAMTSCKEDSAATADDDDAATPSGFVTAAESVSAVVDEEDNTDHDASSCLPVYPDGGDCYGGDDNRDDKDLDELADNSASLTDDDAVPPSITPPTEFSLSDGDGGCGNIVELSLSDTKDIIPDAAAVELPLSAASSTHGALAALSTDSSRSSDKACGGGEVVIQNDEHSEHPEVVHHETSTSTTMGAASGASATPEPLPCDVTVSSDKVADCSYGNHGEQQCRDAESAGVLEQSSVPTCDKDEPMGQDVTKLGDDGSQGNTETIAWEPAYNGGLQLDELHDDVIFHIAWFLSAREIRYGLAGACRRLEEMFAERAAYWRARVYLKYSSKVYPAVAVEDFPWVEGCVAREDAYSVWAEGAWQGHTQHFLYGNGIHGEVDVVHLMKDGQLLVTGDRNRSMNLVDLTKWDPQGDRVAVMKDMLVHTSLDHGGWIWSMASVGDTLVTGCWDTRVRTFDMAAGCSLALNVKVSSAVLSLYAEETEVVASCYRDVVFLDRRSGRVERKMVPHSKPVLCVVGGDRYILTGSEDRSICVLDRRAGKVMSRLKLENYPLCMSYQDNQLWYGDRLGHLHLLDGTHGAFTAIGEYDVAHKEKVTGIVTGLGANFSCSGDKTVKVWEPTRDPEPIASLDVHAKEVAKIDYKSGVLVSAGGDECVGVWMPNHWGDPHARHLV